MEETSKEKVEEYVRETEDGLGRSFGQLQWLADEIYGMRKNLREIGFYKRMANADSIEAYAWIRQLYYHSKEFPQILASRYAKCREDHLRKFFMEHVVVEAGHSDMCREWMTEHGLIRPDEDYTDTPRNLATTGCISYGWRLVEMESVEAQIVSLNVATECASWDFFSFITPMLEKMGKSHEYWRVHVVADQFHSADGLMQLKPVEKGSREGKYLVRIARESLVHWGFMLNSWVGINVIPDI